MAEHKRAKNGDDADEMRHRYHNPAGSMQWKGTDVCMDWTCACSAAVHVDAGFCYYVECPVCGRVYYCNPEIELIELEERPDGSIQVGDVF